MKDKLRIPRIPVLIDQLANAAAVEGIGEVSAKTFGIERLGPAQSLLLVRYQTNFDGAVGDLRMCLQIGNRIDDGGDGRLVIGPQQAGAVGHDDPITDIVGQLGELAQTQGDLLVGIEADIAPS